LLQEHGRQFVAAARAGRVVGTGGACLYSGRLAWVCMILVDEAERGHGIGSLIVRSVLERVADVETVGLDATPKGRPVYERLGFAAASTFVRIGGSASGAVGTASISARPVREDDIPAIAHLD